MRTHHQSDEPRARDDSFARESFTFRRMQPWQIVALAIFAVVFVVLGVLYIS
jgi:ElaB/YqjD/DUF883 family membrane-anchored ribosome-binding protein